MYHTIEFAVEVVVDLEISRKHRLEKLHVGKGMRLHAELRPRVVETSEGPVEVADLFFEDGTVTRQVPFDRFMLVD